MDKKIYLQVRDILKKRKDDAENTARQNLINALQIAEVKSLYNELIDMRIKVTKDEAYGKKTQTKQLAKLESEFSKCLKKYNIKNILPTYTCSKCKDTGMNGTEFCECFTKEVSRLLSLGNTYENYTFENSDFSKFSQPEEIKKIYDKLQKWCEQKTHNKSLILISGEVGVGKTFLLSCMANKLTNLGNFVTYTTAFAINEKLIKSRFLNTYPLNDILNTPYLFIDDLGSESRYKDVTESGFLNIINERKIKHLPTIISTNLDLAKISELYGERFCSRIIDNDSSLRIKIDSVDLRKNKK